MGHAHPRAGKPRSRDVVPTHAHTTGRAAGAICTDRRRARGKGRKRGALGRHVTHPSCRTGRAGGLLPDGPAAATCASPPTLGSEMASAGKPGLSYPSHTAPAGGAAAAAARPPPPAAEPAQTRLYVGNLAASVDEYALLKAFQRFGRLRKLDFLFHKAGPQRGLPRGYAFIEYDAPAAAAHALRATTTGAGATLRGRKLHVAYASHRQEEPDEYPARPRPRPPPQAAEDRHTALSARLAAATPSTVEGRIAAMEAKLASMEEGQVQGGPPGEGPPERPPSGQTSWRDPHAARGAGQHPLPQKPSRRHDRRAAPYSKHARPPPRPGSGS